VATRKVSVAAAHPVPDREGLAHASPLVRRFARELGVPIEGTEGSGPQGRILVEDLKRTVRERFAGSQRATGAAPGAESAGAIPSVPAGDYAAFGPVREEKLTRIQKVSGPALHRSWLNVPHVTQHDEADITALERFRRDRQAQAGERGLRLSPLLFAMKAVVAALRAHPTFRSSLVPEGDRLIVKEYFHLGIAVDTDQGLVVPVIRDVDRKGIFELAAELSETAERARNRKLVPEDLAGACFTISSLGGIGGTAFSPIVNAPEVAILGLSRTRIQPVWEGPSPLETPTDAEVQRLRAGEAGAPPAGPGRFVPRLVLPLSLSYDHRVIDGAEAVRFTTRLAAVLADPMQLLL
jgi:pyruvate dehydrogenase E2 component (dihydrolipoamide acetyltransferase)